MIKLQIYIKPVRHDVVLTTVMHELLWVIASTQLKKYLLNKQD